MIGRSLANFILAVRANNSQTANASSGKYQIVRMDLTYSGYNPNVLSVKKGVPVRWIINAKQMSGCTNSIILRGAYNISKDL